MVVPRRPGQAASLLPVGLGAVVSTGLVGLGFDESVHSGLTASAAAVVFSAMTAIGWIVVRRVPQNAVGWLLCGTGLLCAMTGAGESYARHGRLGPGARLPGGPVVGVLGSLALAIKDKGDEDGALGLFVILTLLADLGSLLLAGALLRGRSAPTWAVIVFAAGVVIALVLAFIGAPPMAVVEAAAALMFTGMVPVAWRSLTAWQVAPAPVSTHAADRSEGHAGDALAI